MKGFASKWLLSFALKLSFQWIKISGCMPPPHRTVSNFWNFWVVFFVKTQTSCECSSLPTFKSTNSSCCFAMCIKSCVVGNYKFGIKEKKVKCTKKLNTHTHSNLSNKVDSKSKQTELTYNESQFPKIPIQRETFSFYSHRSKN